MSAEVETMMYAGETPWHGFGVYVGDEDLDSKTAIIKAGLDWEVEKKDMFVDAEDTKSTDDRIMIPDHKAIVRTSDESVLGVVGSRYHPVQNKEAFEFMDSLVETGKMKYHTAGSLRNGQKVWLLGKIGDTEIIPGDKVDHYLLLYNTHDGSQSLRVLFTNVRVVCANTAQAALADGRNEGMKVRHTVGLPERMAQANEILGISKEQFSNFRNFANLAAGFNMPANTWNEFTQRLIPDPPADINASKRILTVREGTRATLTDLFHNGVGQDIPGVAGTGWAAYNAVVEYANYYRGAKGDEKRQRRFESSLFGGSSAMITKAVKEIAQMAA